MIGEGLRRVPRWLLIGLAIRIVLIPFHHPWDLQTWYNMFVDLAHNHSPYETLRYLTYSTRSQWGLIHMDGAKVLPVGQELFYEYYAYPPLPLLLYYPLAKLYALFRPLEYQFVVEGALAAHHVPLAILALFKAPLIVADIGVAVLLWRLAGEARARAYFLNPFVILVSAAWMIEDLMILFVLLAFYLVTRKRYELAGLASGLGVLVKWTPGILWPVIGLWLLAERAPWRRQAAFHAVFLATCVAGIAPVWDGVRLVLQFHAMRPGANLSPHILLYVLAQWHNPDIAWYYHVLSPFVGMVTLPLALGAAYLAQWRGRLPLATGACLAVVAFFLGSKIVNEPYVCVLLPLLLWEEAERPSEAKAFVFKAAYALPLAYAIINVPIPLFIVPAYLQVVPWDPTSDYWIGLLRQAVPGRWHALALAGLAFCFVGVMLYAWRVLTAEVGDAAVRQGAHRPDPDRARIGPAYRPVAQDAS
jgi:hypothetical protein